MSGGMSSDEIKLPTRHNIVFPVRRLESVTDASYQPSCSDCHVKSERTIDCAVNAAGFRMINEPVFIACQYESTVRCSFPLVFWLCPLKVLLAVRPCVRSSVCFSVRHKPICCRNV